MRRACSQLLGCRSFASAAAALPARARSHADAGARLGPGRRKQAAKKEPARHLSEMVNSLSRRGQPLKALEMLRTGSDVLQSRPEALSHAVRATMAGLTSMGRGSMAIDLYEDAVRHWAMRPSSFVLLQLSRVASAPGNQAARVVRLLMAEVRQTGGTALAPPAWGAALHACARASDSASALELFGLSRRAPGAERGGAAGTGGAGAQAPPAFTEAQQRDMLVSTLAACARARDVPRALSAQQMAEAEGTTLDLACTNALLHVLSRGVPPRLEHAVSIFERAVALDEKHGAEAGHMDATTVNTAISACAAARRADEAFRLQALAAARGVRADVVTITNLLLACCRDPAEAGGARALRTMRCALARGFRPDALCLQTLERAMGTGAEARWRAQRALDELALEMGEPRGWRAIVKAARDRPVPRARGSRSWLAERSAGAELGVEAEAAEAAAKAARAETAAAEAAMEAHPSESIGQMVGWVRDLQARLDSAIDHGIDRSGLGRVVEATSTKTARYRSLQPPGPTRGCDPTRPACSPWDPACNPTRPACSPWDPACNPTSPRRARPTCACVACVARWMRWLHTRRVAPARPSMMRVPRSTGRCRKPRWRWPPTGGPRLRPMRQQRSPRAAARPWASVRRRRSTRHRWRRRCQPVASSRQPQPVASTASLPRCDYSASGAGCASHLVPPLRSLQTPSPPGVRALACNVGALVNCFICFMYCICLAVTRQTSVHTQYTGLQGLCVWGPIANRLAGGCASVDSSPQCQFTVRPISKGFSILVRCTGKFSESGGVQVRCQCIGLNLLRCCVLYN